MSFHEGTEYGEKNRYGSDKNKTIGGCGKHPGQPLVNCPLCAIEEIKEDNKKIIHGKSIQELAVEHGWSGEETMQASCCIVAMRMYKKGINPEIFMKVVNNWERIEKAINILKHDLL